MCKGAISARGANFSRIKLNAYKAMTNSAYLCQATNDPIHYAFVLDTEVRVAALIDKEFQVILVLYDEL